MRDSTPIEKMRLISSTIRPQCHCETLSVLLAQVSTDDRENRESRTHFASAVTFASRHPRFREQRIT